MNMCKKMTKYDCNYDYYGQQKMITIKILDDNQ